MQSMLPVHKWSTGKSKKKRGKEEDKKVAYIQGVSKVRSPSINPYYKIQLYQKITNYKWKCPPFCSLTDFNLFGIEWTKFFRVLASMSCHSFRILDFSCTMVTWGRGMKNLLIQDGPKIFNQIQVRWVKGTLTLLDKSWKVFWAPPLGTFRSVCWCSIMNRNQFRTLCSHLSWNFRPSSLGSFQCWEKCSLQK